MIGILIFVYYFKTGLSAQDHGVINRSVFIAATFAMLLMYFIVRGLIKIMRKHEKLFAAIFVILASVLYYTYNMRFHHSCDGWADGLAGHKLENTEDV